MCGRALYREFAESVWLVELLKAVSLYSTQHNIHQSHWRIPPLTPGQRIIGPGIGRFLPYKPQVNQVIWVDARFCLDEMRC